MIKIVERDFAAFFDVPFHAYDAGSAYVSPLKSDLKRFLTAGTNPLFPDETAFNYYTALKDGRPLGRIVVHEHRKSNQLYGTKRASFGFFDCADDPAVATALLSKAESWARDGDFDELVGNFNLTAMQQMGVQTDHFDRPGYTDMVVNPPHIPELLKQNGFDAFFPVTTFDLDLANAIIPQGQLPEEFRFAPIKRRTFKARMEDARNVLNDGFAQTRCSCPRPQKSSLFRPAK